MSDDQNNPNAMHELKTPEPTKASFAPCPGSVTKLDGYRAAGILIERMLNEAKAKCPKRIGRINRKSAEYRAGSYEAILTAHCLMVYGEYPTHEINAPVILKTLQSLNE